MRARRQIYFSRVFCCWCFNFKIIISLSLSCSVASPKRSPLGSGPKKLQERRCCLHLFMWCPQSCPSPRSPSGNLGLPAPVTSEAKELRGGDRGSSFWWPSLHHPKGVWARAGAYGNARRCLQPELAAWASPLLGEVRAFRARPGGGARRAGVEPRAGAPAAI